MSTNRTERPWYILDGPCEEYKRSLGDTGPTMLKLLKTVRAIIVNVGLVAISLSALSQGGDATIIGPLALLVLAGYNGVEYADYMALVRAYSEYQDERDRGRDN
jgi:hypothetical protein